MRRFCGLETLIRSQFHFFGCQAYTAKTLYGINMEQRLGCLGLEQLSELFDRLYRADLVVDSLAGEKKWWSSVSASLSTSGVM